MKRTIICFDIDGTLVDEHRAIHPNDLRLLQNPGELMIIPTTGRLLHSVKSLFSREGLWHGQKIPLYMALQNGSILYQPGEVILRQAPFDRDVQDQLVQIAKEITHPSLSFSFFEVDTINQLNSSPEWDQLLESFDLKMIPFNRQSQEKAFFKITANTTHTPTLQRIIEKVQNLPVEFTLNMGKILEINPPGINKGSSILELAKDWPRNEVTILAIGDSGNDLPMLQIADFSFTVDASSPELKSKVHRVIDPLQEGVFYPMLRTAGILN